ncbi:hypothetical protein FYK55_01540 [Roseiconus nitratireducens]|uniref:Uncharacterized protein n=1 Tax=Roseiconus nitratireducens TaxID=2605748 RepID=A0A5M6DHU5_9BACT|nr:hypothetical protein [Roseiconus nitratireducens]KAA5547127.1 hypothetical protein FYK55_01540 [Roseiconus nitratireducens]
MRYGIQTLLIVTLGFALVFALFDVWPLLVYLLYLVSVLNTVMLPFVLIVIGLAAPQRGTSLDVQSIPAFVTLGRIWCVSACLWVLLSLVLSWVPIGI